MASKGLFGIFFISAASLMLEVSLMRFFSIMEFYHFAFLAVGVALFGGAAAGTYIFVKEPKDPLFRSCLLFSASALASFVVLNRMSFDPVRASVDWWHLLRLIPYYLLLSLPFFFSGMVLAYSFKVWQSDSARVYLFNLVGAAVGALGVLFLIASLGEHAIRAVCLMGVFGGVFFAKKRKDAISLFVLSVIILMAPLEIRMSQYKDLSRALNHPGAELLDTRWNGFSRVDLANGSFARYAPGLSMQYRMLLPQQMGVFIDGQMVGAFTCGEDLRFMDYLPSSIGYGLGFENPRTLILDSGAGMDVQAAKRNGAKVTAIDANPSVADLARGEYSHFTGGVYEGIDVHVGHPRSFLKTGEKFDIIVLSPGGGSFGSGIHGLNENYLLTVDAFRQYHEHLD